jgi:Ca2+/Na+ antiporter
MMIAAIEKRWPRISFLLLLALIVTFFIWPGKLTWLGPALFALSMTVAIVFLIRRPIRAYRAGEVNRSDMFRQMALDLAGFLLPVSAALLAGRILGQAVSAQLGFVAGLLSAFAAAWLAGFGISLAWRRLALPRLKL